MPKKLAYILSIFVLLAFSMSCKRRRVIPEDKMSAIFAEMYILDQWLTVNDQSFKNLDTTFVYGEILDKYGFTPEDYRHSVKTYLDDPEDFAKLFVSSRDILNQRIDDLSLEDRIRHQNDSIATAWKAYLKTIPVPELYKDILVGFYPKDTLALGTDSLKYRLLIPEMDTVFTGPAFSLREKRDSTQSK